MIHFCDICSSPLKRSGNASIYFCDQQTEWFVKLNRNITYYHCLNNYDDSGIALFKIITTPPYVFEIDYSAKHTKITKMISFKEKTLKNVPVAIGTGHGNVEEKLYCELPTVLELPWNNIQKVEEKLRLYNLFY